VVLGKQSVAEAGKEFLNHAVGEEGHVNSCRIVWWSERTSPIHVSEQRGAVHQQMHTRNHTAYHIQFAGWFSVCVSSLVALRALRQECRPIRMASFRLTFFRPQMSN